MRIYGRGKKQSHKGTETQKCASRVKPVRCNDGLSKLDDASEMPPHCSAVRVGLCASVPLWRILLFRPCSPEKQPIPSQPRARPPRRQPHCRGTCRRESPDHTGGRPLQKVPDLSE